MEQNGPKNENNDENSNSPHLRNTHGPSKSKQTGQNTTIIKKKNFSLLVLNNSQSDPDSQYSEAGMFDKLQKEIQDTNEPKENQKSQNAEKTKKVEKFQFRPIHCQAKYSEEDIENLEKSQKEMLRYVDFSFNYNLKNLIFEKNGDFKKTYIEWVRLSNLFDEDEYCLFLAPGDAKTPKNTDLDVFKKSENEPNPGQLRPFFEHREGEWLPLDQSLASLYQQDSRFWINRSNTKNAFGLVIDSLGEDYFRGLIVTKEQDKAVEAYRVQLNISGIWTEFILDDYYPVLKGGQDEVADAIKGHRFLYQSPISPKNQIWPIVVEKALAKAYGGYHKLGAISVPEIVSCLLSAPTCQFVIDPRIADSGEGDLRFIIGRSGQEQAEQILGLLQSSTEQGYLVSAQYLSSYTGNTTWANLGGKSGFFYTVKAVERTTQGHIIKMLAPPTSETPKNSKTVKTEKSQKSKNHAVEISFQAFLETFSIISVVQHNKTYSYNSIHIPLASKSYLQSVVKIGVQESGLYTFQLKQKSRRLYPLKTPLRLNSVIITLAKLIEGGVEYITHAVSDYSGTVVFGLNSTAMESGYVLLIDLQVNKKNLVFEKDWEGDTRHWRDLVLTVYGKEYCRLDSLALDPNRGMIYDFFLHRTWKHFSRISKSGDFGGDIQVKDGGAMKWDLVLDDKEQSRVRVVREVFILPHILIYKFTNLSEVNIEISELLKAEKLIKNLECFGPFEVNNVDPKILVNAYSSEILLFKFNNRIEQVSLGNLKNQDFLVKRGTEDNPEEYYGQDPFEYLQKLHVVRPSITYPVAYLGVKNEDFLINNLDFLTFLADRGLEGNFGGMFGDYGGGKEAVLYKKSPADAEDAEKAKKGKKGENGGNRQLLLGFSLNQAVLFFEGEDGGSRAQKSPGNGSSLVEKSGGLLDPSQGRSSNLGLDSHVPAESSSREQPSVANQLLPRPPGQFVESIQNSQLSHNLSKNGPRNGSNVVSFGGSFGNKGFAQLGGLKGSIEGQIQAKNQDRNLGDSVGLEGGGGTAERRGGSRGVFEGVSDQNRRSLEGVGGGNLGHNSGVENNPFGTQRAHDDGNEATNEPRSPRNAENFQKLKNSGFDKSSIKQDPSGDGTFPGDEEDAMETGDSSYDNFMAQNTFIDLNSELGESGAPSVIRSEPLRHADSIHQNLIALEQSGLENSNFGEIGQNQPDQNLGPKIDTEGSNQVDLNDLGSIQRRKVDSKPSESEEDDSRPGASNPKIRGKGRNTQFTRPEKEEAASPESGYRAESGGFGEISGLSESDNLGDFGRIEDNLGHSGAGFGSSGLQEDQESGGDVENTSKIQEKSKTEIQQNPPKNQQNEIRNENQAREDINNHQNDPQSSQGDANPPQSTKIGQKEPWRESIKKITSGSSYALKGIRISLKDTKKGPQTGLERSADRRPQLDKSDPPVTAFDFPGSKPTLNTKKGKKTVYRVIGDPFYDAKLNKNRKNKPSFVAPGTAQKDQKSRQEGAGAPREVQNQPDRVNQSQNQLYFYNQEGEIMNPYSAQIGHSDVIGVSGGPLQSQKIDLSSSIEPSNISTSNQKVNEIDLFFSQNQSISIETSIRGISAPQYLLKSKTNQPNSNFPKNDPRAKSSQAASIQQHHSSQQGPEGHNQSINGPQTHQKPQNVSLFDIIDPPIFKPKNEFSPNPKAITNTDHLAESLSRPRHSKPLQKATPSPEPSPIKINAKPPTGKIKSKNRNWKSRSRSKPLKYGLKNRISQQKSPAEKQPRRDFYGRFYHNCYGLAQGYRPGQPGRHKNGSLGREKGEQSFDKILMYYHNGRQLTPTMRTNYPRRDPGRGLYPSRGSGTTQNQQRPSSRNNGFGSFRGGFGGYRGAEYTPRGTSGVSGGSRGPSFGKYGNRDLGYKRGVSGNQAHGRPGSAIRGAAGRPPSGNYKNNSTISKKMKIPQKPQNRQNQQVTRLRRGSRGLSYLSAGNPSPQNRPKAQRLQNTKNQPRGPKYSSIHQNRNKYSPRGYIGYKKGPPRPKNDSKGRYSKNRSTSKNGPQPSYRSKQGTPTGPVHHKIVITGDRKIKYYKNKQGNPKNVKLMSSAKNSTSPQQGRHPGLSKNTQRAQYQLKPPQNPSTGVKSGRSIQNRKTVIQPKSDHMKSSFAQSRLSERSRVSGSQERGIQRVSYSPVAKSQLYWSPAPGPYLGVPGVGGGVQTTLRQSLIVTGVNQEVRNSQNRGRGGRGNVTRLGLPAGSLRAVDTSEREERPLKINSPINYRRI